MINYSIIIPHYKSIDTLPRLLLSIPDRQDIQIIVIDDNSGMKKAEFQCLPSFVLAEFTLVFLPKNKGAGGARNDGLKIATGKWLLFADADDYFVEDAFPILDKYFKDESDIIYFKTQSIYVSEGVVGNRGNYYNNLVDQYSSNDEKAIDKLRFNHGVPWAKMIKRELVILNNIQFDEIKYSNDVMFSTKIGYFARNITVSNQIVYCVTNNKGSLTSHKSKDALLCRYETALRQNKFLREIGKAKCQKSIMSYLRLSTHYGISTFVKFIRIGIKNGADFSVGIFHWHEYVIRSIKSKCSF